MDYSPWTTNGLPLQLFAPFIPGQHINNLAVLQDGWVKLNKFLYQPGRTVHAMLKLNDGFLRFAAGKQGGAV